MNVFHSGHTYISVSWKMLIFWGNNITKTKNITETVGIFAYDWCFNMTLLISKSFWWMSSAENIYRVTDWRASVCWPSVVCQGSVATVSRERPASPNLLPHARLYCTHRTALASFHWFIKNKNSSKINGPCPGNFWQNICYKGTSDCVLTSIYLWTNRRKFSVSKTNVKGKNPSKIKTNKQQVTIKYWSFLRITNFATGHKPFYKRWTRQQTIPESA